MCPCRLRVFAWACSNHFLIHRHHPPALPDLLLTRSVAAEARTHPERRLGVVSTSSPRLREFCWTRADPVPAEFGPASGPALARFRPQSRPGLGANSTKLGAGFDLSLGQAVANFLGQAIDNFCPVLTKLGREFDQACLGADPIRAGFDHTSPISNEPASFLKTSPRIWPR